MNSGNSSHENLKDCTLKSQPSHFPQSVLSVAPFPLGPGMLWGRSPSYGVSALLSSQTKTLTLTELQSC